MYFLEEGQELDPNNNQTNKQNERSEMIKEYWAQEQETFPWSAMLRRIREAQKHT